MKAFGQPVRIKTVYIYYYKFKDAYGLWEWHTENSYAAPDQFMAAVKEEIKLKKLGKADTLEIVKYRKVIKHEFN